MKAGTTSFVDMLSNHTDIYICPIKEPNYFVDDLPKTIYSPSRFFSLEDYFENKFPKSLHIAKVEKAEDYERLFSLENDKQYYVDASTVYLHAKESPALIKAYNPQAKIIILTREPLKRAYSHYSMNVELGREVRSFEEVIKSDIKDFKDGCLERYSYLNMSLYKESISRYQKTFGEDNVYVTSLAEVNNDLFFDRLLNFLDIENQNIEINKTNQSKSISNPRLVKFLFDSGLKDIGSKILPKSLRSKIFDLISSEKKDIVIRDSTADAFNKIVLEESNKYEEFIL